MKAESNDDLKDLTDPTTFLRRSEQRERLKKSPEPKETMASLDLNDQLKEFPLER